MHLFHSLYFFCVWGRTAFPLWQMETEPLQNHKEKWRLPDGHTQVDRSMLFTHNPVFRFCKPSFHGFCKMSVLPAWNGQERRYHFSSRDFAWTCVWKTYPPSGVGSSPKRKGGPCPSAGCLEPPGGTVPTTEAPADRCITWIEWLGGGSSLSRSWFLFSFLFFAEK